MVWDLINIATRAMRRRHCVGGGVPVNFGRRRRTKKSAVARHGRPKTVTFFSKIPEKNVVLSSQFSHELF